MLQERYKSKTEEQFAKALNEALGNVVSKLAKTEDENEQKRLKSIKAQIEEELRTIYTDLKAPIKEDMQDFSSVSFDTLGGALEKVSGVAFGLSAIPTGTMKEIINMDRIILMGDRAYTLNELFKTASDNQIDRYKQIINAGLASNSGYAEITRNLKQTTQIAQTELRAIVHTAIASARDLADADVDSFYDTEIIGWQSVAVLDSRTSFICASLDGKKYMKPKYSSTQDIPNRPPRHFRCRSILKRLTKNDISLTRAQNGDTKGQIDANTNFGEWFKNQSSTFQRDYLGKARYDLYSNNRLDIKSFVDVKDGKLFTIKEIKEMLT